MASGADKDHYVGRILYCDTNQSYTSATPITFNSGFKAPTKSYNNAGHADLTAADSNCTVFVTQDAAYTINVPDPVAGNTGVRYRFVVAVTGANAITINTVTANSSKFIVAIANGDGTTQTAKNTTGQNTVKFAATATVGDTIDIVSNGTLWIGTGTAQLHDKITCP